MHLAHLYFLNRLGYTYTGYIQVDQPYYVQLGLATFTEGFGVWAPNVTGPEISPARIYFFLPIWLIGLSQYLTDLPPALVFNIWGWVACVAAFYQLIRLIESIAPLHGLVGMLLVLCLAWGGGSFAVAGALSGENLETLFRFDPFQGWWFLNFGRNMVFPMEAIYHFLFLLLLRSLLAQRHRLALLCVLLLSLSSPFAGAQAICFTFGWFLLEKLFFSRQTTSFWAIAGTLGILCYHVLYYLVVLNQDLMHASVHTIFHKDWQLHALPMILAYSLPGIFVLLQFRRSGLRNFAFLRERSTRLGLALFGASFLLANNEWFLSRPIQPLHFTRGYLWLGLMIAGLPALHALLQQAWDGRWVGNPAKNTLQRGASRLGALLLTGIFLLDNTLWIALLPVHNRQPTAGLSESEREIIQYFQQYPDPHGRLFWPHPMKSMVLYNKAGIRSWRSHESVTPFSWQRLEEMEQAREDLQFTDEMRQHNLYLALDPAKAEKLPAAYAARYPGGPPVRKVMESSAWVIYRVPLLDWTNEERQASDK